MTVPIAAIPAAAKTAKSAVRIVAPLVGLLALAGVALVIFVVLLPLLLISALFGGNPLSLGPPTNLGVVSPPAAIVALDESVAAASRPLVACHVPAAILLAQQSVESGYDPSATSPAGAEGLAQFEPTTWPSYARPVPPGGMTPPTPWDPTDAAYGEARFLCANGFTSTPAGSLVAYNCGSASAVCRAVSGRYASEILQLAQRIATPVTSAAPSHATAAPPKKGSAP